MFNQAANETQVLPTTVHLWIDPLPRSGYANMAADELLTRRPECWLRIYGWSRPAVSFGYFDTAEIRAGRFGIGIQADVQVQRESLAECVHQVG